MILSVPLPGCLVLPRRDLDLDRPLPISEHGPEFVVAHFIDDVLYRLLRRFEGRHQRHRARSGLFRCQPSERCRQLDRVVGSTKICGVNRRRQPVRGHRLGRKYENEARIHRLHDQKTTLAVMCVSALTPRILVLPIDCGTLLVSPKRPSNRPGRLCRASLTQVWCGSGRCRLSFVRNQDRRWQPLCGRRLFG